MNTSTEQPPMKGFASLIKAPGATRRFVLREGEIITITDKNGKELWSFKVPAPIDNPGVIMYEVEIGPLTEREFGRFCQQTWTRTCVPQAAPQSAPAHPD
jgi:hypothetical protein